MTAEAASDGWAAFTRRGVTLWLPASVNLGIASLLAPAMNALLARAVDPEASIAGFSVALGVITIVALPQFRIQQLTLVFLHDHHALRSLRRFVAITAAVVGAISCVAALTPLAELILEGIFAATGDLLTQARAALVALCPLPIFMVARTHLHGAALRLGQARLVWLGTGLGAGGAVAISAALIATGIQGAAAAGVGTTLAAGLETVMLMAATRNLLRHGLPAHSPRGLDSSLGAVARFFTPLIFASLLPAATTPIVNAALARTAEPETSLAAFAIAIGLFQFLTILLWGAQPSILALLARGDGMRRITVLTNGVAGVVLIAAMASAFVPPLSQLVIEDISGARDRLGELSLLGLRVLAPLPLILVQEQVFASALMQVRRTRPILYVNVWRLAALLVFVVLALGLEGLPGVAVGAGAWAASLIVEAIATYAYGRGAYRQLTTAEALTFGR
ncbi:MAG: hypothetical protein OXG79_14220 [Chloroflexi bacterium]|nr:hypothetical protein [Chloroflexota bacterium]